MSDTLATRATVGYPSGISLVLLPFLFLDSSVELGFALSRTLPAHLLRASDWP